MPTKMLCATDVLKDNGVDRESANSDDCQTASNV